MTRLRRLIGQNLVAGSTAPAQRFRRDGGWGGRTYGQLLAAVTAAVDALSSAHAQHPVGPGDHVALLAPTRADWTVVDLAVAALGATSVPIYPTSTPAQVADVLARVPVRVIVTVPGVKLPAIPLSTVVLRLGAEDGDLGDLAHDSVGAARPWEALQRPLPDEAAFTIAFSSGSTGRSKACPLTHANYAAVLDAATAVELGDRPAPAHREACFVYLPLAHASARLHQLMTLALGGELVYGSGGTGEVLDQIRATAPTFVPGVPRLFEVARQRAAGDPRALRALFGDRLDHALSGGAPLPSPVLAEYADAGIALVEGYGLTETATALTISAPHDRAPGSVGRALPGVDLRISDDGEVLARGANVFGGYLDDPETTEASFVDGWFRTGDLGRLDAAGHLYVTGRLKNLIVTSTGKNVAPEPLEDALRTRAGVDDVVVVGDGRPFLVAIAVATADRADAVVDAVRSLNAGLAPPERVRRLLVLARPFVQVAGATTPSGKVVRHVLVAAHADLLDTAYAATLATSGAAVLNHPAGDVVLRDVDRPDRLRAAG